MNFRQWYLNEVGTSTASVAVFSRPIFGGPLATRVFPSLVAGVDDGDDWYDKWDGEKKQKKEA